LIWRAVVADKTMTFFGSGWQNSGIEIPDRDGNYLSLLKIPYLLGPLQLRARDCYRPRAG